MLSLFAVAVGGWWSVSVQSTMERQRILAQDATLLELLSLRTLEQRLIELVLHDGLSICARGATTGHEPRAGIVAACRAQPAKTARPCRLSTIQPRTTIRVGSAAYP